MNSKKKSLSLQRTPNGKQHENPHTPRHPADGNLFHRPALPGKTFTLTLTDTNKGVIDGEVGRIGKMPGTLHFTIPVTLAPDGTLKAAKGIEAGKMTMNIGLTRKLVTEDFTGSVRD